MSVPETAPECFLRGVLDQLTRDHLLRDPHTTLRQEAEARASELGVEFLDASSNDYLGLARREVSRETIAPADALPAGAGASRLIHGSHPVHRELEQELASWVRLPDTLFFSSGYAANAGLVSALGAAGTLIVSDALNHASLIDGCRLSRADVRVVPHLDLVAIERALQDGGRAAMRWLVTESYFSMDGDGPDLPALRALCDRYDAGLVVDEAHALGVFGPEGAGRCAEAGVVPDVLIGTLGKSVGVSGAFVAGTETLRTFLWNRARSFVFSTAPSPTLAALAVLHVKQARAADGARANLRRQAAALRRALTDLGLQTLPQSFGPIVPILVGSNEATSRATRALARRGVLAQGIRPPTVPDGTARLRITLNATLDDAQTERLARSLAEVLLPTSVASESAELEPTAAAQEPSPARAPSPPPGPSRIVVLGTGTGVGKTWVTQALARELAHSARTLALKPVESGVADPEQTDATLLARAAGHPPPPPLAALRDPVSPHLAARREGRKLDLADLAAWVLGQAACATTLQYVVVETAGGALSPLSLESANVDLASALEPAFWLLVAPDALGVLHDVRATLESLRARGRTPDLLVLSAARPRDASTGTNAAELALLEPGLPIVTVGRDDDSAGATIVRALRRLGRPSGRPRA